MQFNAANARENAAKSVIARRLAAVQRREAVETAVQAPVAKPETNGVLSERAKELNGLLAGLKADLRAAKDSQDKLRLAQAIDRLEQSWARYAGVPTPPKGRANQRRTMSSPEPLD